MLYYVGRRWSKVVKGVVEVSGTSCYDLIAERYHLPRIYPQKAEACLIGEAL